MNSDYKGGFKIFGIICLIFGFPLTIIGGVLLGMFFLYPLGNVMPEDQYIYVYQEEYLFLTTILGFGIFFLVLAIIFIWMGIYLEHNPTLSSKSKVQVLKEDSSPTEQDLEKLMRKKILSEK